MWVWCHASHNFWPLCAREGFVEALISLCALTAGWVMGTPHSCESREQSLLFSFAQMGGGVGRDRDRQGRRDRENIKNGKAHVLAGQWTLGVHDSPTLDFALQLHVFKKKKAPVITPCKAPSTDVLPTLPRDSHNFMGHRLCHL